MCVQTITKSQRVAVSQPTGFFQPKNEWFDRGIWSRSFGIPDVNIFESRHEYILTIATNGLNKKDINIDNLENTITVCLSGQKKSKQQKGEDFRCSSFSLSFTKPADVVQSKMTVNYEDGMLCICFLK